MGIDLDKIRNKNYRLKINGKKSKFSLTASVSLDNNRKYLTLGSSVRFINNTKEDLELIIYHKK